MGDNQFTDILSISLFFTWNQFINVHGIKFIIKGDILRNRIASSTSRHSLLLPSISYQCKILDIDLAKLLLKLLLNSFK